MYRVRKQIHCEDCVEKGIIGKGITVAVLDTGISSHPDFDDRILLFRDFVHHRQKNYDDSSHGTHVCGILGGSGIASEGKFRGVAPKCNLIVGKILDREGNGDIQHMLDAIDWILSIREEYQIRILNISIGIGKAGDTDTEQKAFQAVERAWNEGLIVVTAAGNSGPSPMTISPMGASNLVITVGCHEGGYFGNNVSGLCESYSGRGPTRYALKKPDVVAPGTDIISCSSRISFSMGKMKNAYAKKSGTSMATPMVSGACALLLQTNPKLTNEEVKRKLMYSATDLKESWSKQGWGMINIDEMLKR